MNALTKITVSIAALLPITAMAEDYFVKELTFPAGATMEQKVEMASRLIPSDRQRAWQQHELTAFLHFGMNTFTNREWGDGSEDPILFNPPELDADQWIRTLKDAGFRLVILTAKHHDGFCLWPTATTRHSVASSPWKDGKGDVVRMFTDACARHGMKVGLYLSPWDRNAPEYGSDAYNDKFVAQLTELLSNYGGIDEVWFDGACGEGPNGKKQIYDWNRFAETIHRLQPQAVTAIMGDDVRWVGNERGEGRETEWSATALAPGILPESDESNSQLGLTALSPDLGSRELIAKADKLYWWPSEVDVSIRPGWFYHDHEQPHSLSKLAEIYLTSVGRNSALLLNIPPDRRGLLSEADTRRIGEFGRWIEKNFTNDLSDGIIDDYTVKLRPGSTVNCVVLSEDISKGQRVEQFSIHALRQGRWSKIADGTTIGHKRIITFSPIQADAVQLHVTSARGDLHLNPVETYLISMPVEADEDFGEYVLIDKHEWSILHASAGVSLDEALAAIDGTASTLWQSVSGAGSKSITIDTGAHQEIHGFVYTPGADRNTAGPVFRYRFSTSANGVDWNEAPLPGEFGNIVNNPVPQRVFLPSPVNARYFRFEALDTADGSDFITIAELSLLTSRESTEK